MGIAGNAPFNLPYAIDFYDGGRYKFGHCEPVPVLYKAALEAEKSVGLYSCSQGNCPLYVVRCLGKSVLGCRTQVVRNCNDTSAGGNQDAE
jgi:hypothetical protein